MRMPRDLHARLQRAAEGDRRTMADFVIIMLERELEALEAAQASRKK